LTERRRNTDTWDTTPGFDLVSAVAAEKWTASGATSELVDNALGRIRGDAKRVIIIHNRTKRQLTVLDDGRGMDHIGQLFQLANGSGVGVDDIGRWGSGGTKALMWLANEVAIWSLRDGKVMRDRIRWKDYQGKTEWPTVNNRWEEASLRNTPTMLHELGHGTMIEMKIRDERVINSDVVQRDLEQTYAPGLRHGKAIKWITLTKGRDYTRDLHPEQLQMPSDKNKIVDFNLKVRIDGEKVLPASGKVALIDDLPFKQSNVAIGFGHRIIFHTRACYQSQDGEKRYSGAGVGGWLDLGHGWQDYLTLAKDEINDDRVRAVLMHHIFTKIEPLLKQIEQDQLSLILDGIALDLGSALGNVNEHIERLAGFADKPALLEFKDSSVSAIIPDPPTNVTFPKPKVVENDPNREGEHDPQKRFMPPVTRIKLVKQTDTEMDHALCSIDEEVMSERDAATEIAIQVNIEHEVVLEMLQGRPTNKMALNLMLTRELAAALSHHPKLMDRILAPRIKRVLNQLGENGARERYLARALMDSARRPKADEAA